MRLDRRQIDPGLFEEADRCGPDAGRSDTAANGEVANLNLPELQRNLAIDADANHGDSPFFRGEIEYLLEGGVMSGCFDHQLRTLATGKGHYLLDHLVGRLQHAVHTQFKSRFPATRDRVDHDHARAHADRRGCRAKPDRAAARYHDCFARVGPARAHHRVVSAREWLDEGARRIVQVRWKLVKPLRLDSEVLAIRSIHRKAKMMKAFGRFHHTFAYHAIADVQSRDELAYLDDFTAPFVARCHRVRNGNDVTATEQFVVGVANPDCARADQYFRVFHLWNRNVLDDRLAGGFEYKSFHSRLRIVLMKEAIERP